MLAAPQVSLVKIDHEKGKNIAQITLKVSDDNLERLAVFVGEVLAEKRVCRSLLLVGEDIMIYRTSQLSPETTITVPVQPGLNMIRLEATDRNDLTNIVPIPSFYRSKMICLSVISTAPPAAELVP